MKTIFKLAAAATLTGALALAAVTPSEARGGRNAAVIGGFAAGALLGAAVANSNNGYYDGPGYAYGPSYGYAPGYYAEPGYAYDSGYAYESGYVYDPGPRYYRSGPTYYRSNTSNCGGSPASLNAGSC